MIQSGSMLSCAFSLSVCLSVCPPLLPKVLLDSEDTPLHMKQVGKIFNERDLPILALLYFILTYFSLLTK